jgi:2-polyprenyl-6-methoxyphenol hydroxylase-like FAD-dependent oxidoreductase
MRVLISGAGIAGPTLAYRLLQYGMQPTMVERAPQLRTGGYIVDFWGCGYDVADRMGLLPEINQKGYKVREIRVLDSQGEIVASFPASAFDRATHGHFISLPRSELAAAICATTEGKVETIFGDSIAALQESGSAVRVRFEHSPAREFDLVVGADGLHSKVRELAFGPESQYEKYLGCKVAAFSAEGYQPRDELVYVMHTEVGQQVARFSMRDDRTLFLFTFADENPDSGDSQAQKDLLRKRFANSGWECAKILEALDSSTDFYFDRISQIRIEGQQWSRGRVVLLGDAASCVSLMAGEGSSLAMTAAYILAGELHRAGGDYAAAFARYQQLFGPFVAEKQKMALRFAGWFAPPSNLSIFLRNQGMKLLKFPPLANLIVGRDLVDHITLPRYAA